MIEIIYTSEEHWKLSEKYEVAVHFRLIGMVRRNGVPLEMHILPRGDHGLALASAETNSETESVKDWPIWAERWIRAL